MLPWLSMVISENGVCSIFSSFSKNLEPIYKVLVPYMDSALNMDTPNIFKRNFIDTWRYVLVKKSS